MSLRKNIIANYCGAVFAALVPILSLPWYLRLLGEYAWGQLSFLILIQTLMGLIEVSFGQLITKEVASSPDKQRLGVVIRSFEFIYWGIAFAAALLVLALSGAISKHWLNVQDQNVVWGASLLIFTQLPSSLYRSVLVGAERQVSLNLLTTISLVLRHLGAVVLLHVSPYVHVYIVWHSFITLVETLILSYLSKANLAKSALRYDFKEIKPLFTKSLHLSVGVIAGIVTLQMDRIILSFKMPLSELGLYTIAVTVSQGALRAVTPVFNAVLPRLVKLKSDKEALTIFNLKFAFLISLIVFGCAFLFYMYGEQILKLWLKDDQIVLKIYPIIACLLIGTCLNAYYSIGYLNWIANEKTHKIFLVNISSLIASVPAMMVLIPIYGLLGGTFGWIFINLIGLILSLEWLYTKS